MNDYSFIIFFFELVTEIDTIMGLDHIGQCLCGNKGQSTRS